MHEVHSFRGVVEPRSCCSIAEPSMKPFVNVLPRCKRSASAKLAASPVLWFACEVGMKAGTRLSQDDLARVDPDQLSRS